MPEFLDTNPAVPGTGAGDALPPQIALAITLRSSVAGKSGRGRVYLGGWNEASNAATGDATSGVPGVGVAFINGIDTGLQPSALKLGVLSKPSYHITIVRTVFRTDGTTEVKTLSDQKAKPGGIVATTSVQSRDGQFETVRRRNNSRGAVPSLASDDVIIQSMWVPQTGP
jgi:hypothetical protein